MPVAVASGPASVPDEETPIELDGSASYDPDGSIVSYAWEQIAGPLGWFSHPTGATTTFTPGESPIPTLPVAGAAMWLDASQVSGIADGGAVAQWDNLAGTPHAVQPNAAFQPTFHLNVLNGLPTVRFGGTGLTLSTLVVPLPLTVFVVVRRTATSQDGSIVGDTIGAIDFCIHGGSNAPYMATYGASNLFLNGAGAAALGTFYCLSGVWNGAASSIAVRAALLRGSGMVSTGGRVGQQELPGGPRVHRYRRALRRPLPAFRLLAHRRHRRGHHLSGRHVGHRPDHRDRA